MEKQSSVATYVQQRINELGKSQQDFAKEFSLGQAEFITQIAQGKAKLPLGEVCEVAKALKANPVQLVQLCLKEYHQEAWKLVDPLLEASFTADEVRMVRTWRSYVGCPYIAALSEESQDLLTQFLSSLKTPSRVQ